MLSRATAGAVIFLFAMLLAALWLFAASGPEMAVNRPERSESLGESGSQLLVATPADGDTRIQVPEAGDSEEEVPQAGDDQGEGTIFRVRVLSEELLPLGSARARLRLEERWSTANSTGTIYLRTRLPTPEILVEAPGYQMARRELSAFNQTVVLTPDLGLEFRIVWGDSGLPVDQAVIELTRVLQHSPWLLDADRESSLCRTDGAGVARLYGVWNEGSRSSVVVRHPEAVSTIVHIGSWTRPGETQSVLIELVRETTNRFRIVDELGRGVANAPVSMFVGDHEISTQSDNFGYVEPQYDIRFGQGKSAKKKIGHLIWVQLAENRMWVLAGSAAAREDLDGQLFRVRHEPVTCRVLNNESRQVECATAFATFKGQESWADHFPQVDRLVWVPADGDGRVVLESGWQGYRTSVLVRDRRTGTLLAGKLLPTGAMARKGVVTITLPDFCVVALENQSDSSRMLLRRMDRRSSPFVEYDIDAREFMVEAGRYAVSQRVGSSLVSLPHLDAAGPAASYVVPPWPQLREIGGKIRGSMSGAYTGVRVHLSDAGGNRAGPTTTAPDGTFHFSAVCDSACELVITSPAQHRALRIAPVPVPMHDTSALDIRIAESRLVLDEGDRVGDGYCETLGLYKWSSDGAWQVVWSRSVKETKELVVESGRYKIQCEVDGRMILERIVDLVDSERVVVDIGDCFFLRLRIEVLCAAGELRPLAVELSDKAGGAIRVEPLKWTEDVGWTEFLVPEGEFAYELRWGVGSTRAPLKGWLAVVGEDVVHAVKVDHQRE